ncbi:serine/threonine protein kinase [Nonomuraea muscovyensis]|uniref:non-specific serine/threonine protein kinase n=1 Tax=Nonomuraea muscovyensis TaxID=1124761 RepID=A0A7X0EWH8_9ACTN|nr:serine/threonine-protein kinase [Nonomuraea muscovyensis]MBB6343641.1 serine/threonine protein kinase [Nonomuraea muscovyensis]
MPNAEPLREGDPASVGPYRLAGRLGVGGQGVVYLAQAPNGAPVAVKVLRDGVTGDERFAEEIAAARRVEPLYVAQVLDAGVTGRPYVVTEYVDGPSLREAGPQAGADLQRLAVATATALAAIHRAGLVHRDFKPANVLLGAGGPRVTDFGLSAVFDGGGAATGGLAGTPAYMAPEQLAGHPGGPAADVFAWAAVMVVAATGVPPFGDDSLAAVVGRILHQEPRLGGLPKPLHPVVAACLVKDPTARPAMRDVLPRLLADQDPDPYATPPAAALPAEAPHRPQPASRTATSPGTPPDASPTPVSPGVPSAAHGQPTAPFEPGSPEPGLWHSREADPLPHRAAALPRRDPATGSQTHDFAPRLDGRPQPGPQGPAPWQDRAAVATAPGAMVWPPRDAATASPAEEPWQPEESDRHPAEPAPKRRRGKTVAIAGASGVSALALAGVIVWLTPTSPQPKSQSLPSASAEPSSAASRDASPTQRPRRTRTPTPAGTADPSPGDASPTGTGTTDPTATEAADRLRVGYLRATGTPNGDCWAGGQVTPRALVVRTGGPLTFRYAWIYDGTMVGQTSATVARNGRLALTAPRSLESAGGTHNVTLRITSPVVRQRTLSVTLCEREVP